MTDRPTDPHTVIEEHLTALIPLYETADKGTVTVELAHMEAVMRLLLNSGDMNPIAVRMIGKVLGQPSTQPTAHPIEAAVRAGIEAEMQRKRDADETVIVQVDGEIREEQP